MMLANPGLLFRDPYSMSGLFWHSTFWMKQVCLLCEKRTGFSACLPFPPLPHCWRCAGEHLHMPLFLVDEIGLFEHSLPFCVYSQGKMHTLEESWQLSFPNPILVMLLYLCWCSSSVHVDAIVALEVQKYTYSWTCHGEQCHSRATPCCHNPDARRDAKTGRCD